MQMYNICFFYIIPYFSGFVSGYCCKSCCSEDRVRIVSDDRDDETEQENYIARRYIRHLENMVSSITSSYSTSATEIIDASASTVNLSNIGDIDTNIDSEYNQEAIPLSPSTTSNIEPSAPVITMATMIRD